MNSSVQKRKAGDHGENVPPRGTMSPLGTVFLCVVSCILVLLIHDIVLLKIVLPSEVQSSVDQALPTVTYNVKHMLQSSTPHHQHNQHNQQRPSIVKRTNSPDPSGLLGHASFSTMGTANGSEEAVDVSSVVLSAGDAGTAVLNFQVGADETSALIRNNKSLDLCMGDTVAMTVDPEGAVGIGNTLSVPEARMERAIVGESFILPDATSTQPECSEEIVGALHIVHSGSLENTTHTLQLCARRGVNGTNSSELAWSDVYSSAAACKVVEPTPTPTPTNDTKPGSGVLINLVAAGKWCRASPDAASIDCIYDLTAGGSGIEAAVAVISGDLLNNRSISSEKLKLGSIVSELLASASVQAMHLTNGSVGSDALDDGVVSSRHIAAGAVGNSHLGERSITSSTLSIGAVLTEHLTDGAVDSAALKLESVLSAHISAGAVTRNSIAADAVGGDELEGGAVTSAHIGSGQVQGTHIATASITSAHIEDNSVLSQHIAGGEIGSAHVDSNAVQLRVTGSCSGRDFIQSVSADGSVSCGAPAASVSHGYRLYTTSDNFTVPEGITEVFVRIQAAGGAGGSVPLVPKPEGDICTKAAAGGGGGGAFAEAAIPVSPGSSIEVSVGVGGIPSLGFLGSGEGEKGGDSSFGDFVVVEGGSSGLRAGGGSGGEDVSGAVIMGFGADGANGRLEDIIGTSGSGGSSGSGLLAFTRGITVVEGATRSKNGTDARAAGVGGSGAATIDTSACGLLGGRGGDGFILVLW